MRNLLQNNLRVFLLLLIIGFSVYANVIPGKFLFDDNLFIENNEQIKSLSNIPKLYYSSVTGGSNVAADNFYRPNQQLVNALLYAAFGLNPVPFHIASILFHIVNAFLIFLLFMRLGINRNPAFFSSLVFLIHPIQTQAVSYISGMADPLGMMFVLSGLIYFINFCEKPIVNLSALSALVANKFFIAAISIFFFVCGLLTKENTVVFPALALIIFLFRFKKNSALSAYLRENKKKISLIGIYFLIAVTYLCFKFTALNFAGNLGLTNQKNIYTENLYIRIITFLNILPEYFKMILFPVRLNYEKPYMAFVDFQSGEGIFGLLAVVMSVGIAIYSLLKKGKSFKTFLQTLSEEKGLPVCRLTPSPSGRVGVGLSWFFISLAPVSGIIPVNAMYLEHWLYYPLIGIIFLGASLYERQKTFLKNIFLILLVPFCIAYCARTILRNSEWADAEKFYKNELKFADKSARMHNNLAMVYADEKKCQLAIQHYKKAIALYDVYPQTHHNLARCYENTGNINDAVDEYFKALLLYPDFAHSHRYLANIFYNAGDTIHAKKFEVFLSRIQNGETISQQEIIAVIDSLKK